MKKIKVEVQTTLTHTPFENIKAMLEAASKDKSNKEGKKNGTV